MNSSETLCSHEGNDPERWLGAIATPIFQTSLFSYKRRDAGYRYTRDSNPTIEAAERLIASLEGAEASACFSSGMGAITASILHCVKSGSRVVAHRNIYGPARDFLCSYLARFGVETILVDSGRAEDFDQVMNDRTTLVYLESPTTFLFKLLDIRGIAEAAKKHSATVVVDNTWATPLNQRPLDLGADLVVHSASKYLSGHSDIVAGVAAGCSDIIGSLTALERSSLGSCMDPHQAFLLSRGIRTLPLRMARHGASALRVAQALEKHPLVERVFWPGLESHEDRHLAFGQLRGYSGLLSFVPRIPRERLELFLRSLELFEVGPSWGGYESLAIAPGLFMTEHDLAELGIPNNLVRISVGLEDPEDLLIDLDRAMQIAVSDRA